MIELEAPEHPGRLGGSKIPGAVGIGRLAGDRSLRHGLLGRVLHPVVGSEKPERVLEHEAAERRAVVEAVVAGDEGIELRILGMLVRGLDRVVAVVDESLAVKLVAARLRDDVDDAARRPAEFRLVAAGLDLDLLDEFVVELLALGPVLDAGRVDAVDDEPVLEPGGAVDHDGVCEGRRVRGLRRDPRRNLDDRRVVAAGRQGLDLAAVDVVADGRRVLIDQRRRARHDDLRTGRGAQLHVVRRRLSEGDRDRGLDPGEALEARRHLVDPGRQQHEAIGSRGIRDARARALEGRPAGLHGHARQGAALLVRDVADDVSGGLSEDEGSGEDEKEEGDGGRESAHGIPSKNLRGSVAQRPPAEGAAQLW